MTVWALGLNHTTAPLDLRGRFALSLEQLAPALDAFKRSVVQGTQVAHDSIQAAILSTCNRTEVYCAVDSSAGSTATASQCERMSLHWLAAQGGVSPDALSRHAYVRQNQDAARHVFRVASGLDSMVLGETQILGQFKEAVRAADDAGALGATLNQLFQRSFAVAKDVRSQTEIGSASISMPAAAVRLASQLFEDLAHTKMLFVGAGEMIELAATHFAATSPNRIVIANRSVARSQALAARLNALRQRDSGASQSDFASAIALAELPSRLHEFDIVVSCTASTLPIIGLGAVERALKARRRKPMFMVDLAVPRDIEPEVKALSDVYLYTVDDLAIMVQQGRASRTAAVAQAEVIVDVGVAQFMHWVAQRESVPLIQRINAQAETWREAELAHARKALAKGEDVNAVMESLSRRLMQKALHGSYSQLNASDALERERAAQAIERVVLRH